MNRWFDTNFRAQVCFAVLFFNAAVASVIAPTLARAQAKPMRIVAFGDSLTAGFRLRPGDDFPAQLQKALTERGYNVEVINAGVSGDTTAAGLERFDWAIPEDADAAIVELGANDALRGIDPAQARRNLGVIIKRLKDRKIEVLLAGMRAPRNLGEDYIRRFDPIFPELAREYGTLLYPFFLEGVALRSDLSLDDGIHPNGRGVTIIVRNILPAVEELIGRVKAKRREGEAPSP